MNSRIILYLILLLGLCTNAYGYEIRPFPQKVENGNTSINMTEEVNLVIDNGTSQKTVDRIKEVLDKYNISFTESGAVSQDYTNIIVGPKDGEITSAYAQDYNIDLSVFEPGENRYDAHILQINANSPNGDIIIIGNGDDSEYYGMATLDQILEQKNGNSMETLTINDYAYTQYRGIVEGFYGHTYSVETRLELLEFCKRYKMNTYIYGPKSDPYHLGWWKEDYPTEVTDEQRFKGFITQDDLRTISAKAIECNVDFVWAAHPGMQNGISFSENGIESGVQELMTKFDHLYSLGLRAFGVFIDDMSYTPSGDMQALLATKTQEALRAQYGSEIAPLFFVPTSYALNYDIGGARLRYLKDVDSEVVIAFTGYDCFSNIRGSASEQMKGYCGRNAVMWWNNPVNDDHDNWIYMRKMTTHWTIEDQNPIPSLGGLVLNPMNQGNASKVILFSAAEYSWNPSQFNDDESWEAFFKTEIKDETIREALRTFAIHSDATVEEQEFINNYETFRQEYSKGNIPAVASDIKEEMEKLYNACVVLEGMKDSETTAYKLLYEDINPWIAKLKTISSIVKDAIGLMQGDSTDSWALGSIIKQKAENLHSDKAYQVSALEEAGTNTYEKFYEAQASKEYLEPFAEYIASLVDDYETAELPERSTEVEIISNMETVPEEISVFEENDITGIKGLENISLNAKEYVGFNMNCIKETSITNIDETIPEGLEIQYSVNGKEWTRDLMTESENEKELVFVRIKNVTDAETIAIPFNTLSINATKDIVVDTPEVTTNMSAYQTYVIDNVIDGNKNTYFWKDGEQAAGDEIVLDYGTSTQRNIITVSFTANDRPTGEVGISLSDDGMSWEEIAVFTSEDLDDNGEYQTDAGGATARYIRLQIKSATGSFWFQIAEISAEGQKVITQAVNEEGKSISILSDRKLGSGYKADKEGYVIYRFIENIKIENISIYNSVDFTGNPNAPKVELLANKEWSELGKLEGYTTKFNVFGIDSISALKISWDNKNIPNLVEIYPEGEPYVEREKAEIVTSLNECETNDITFINSNGVLTIRSGRTINEIYIWNTEGQMVYSENPANTETNIKGLNPDDVYIIEIRQDEGNTVRRKIKL